MNDFIDFFLYLSQNSVQNIVMKPNSDALNDVVIVYVSKK